MSSFMAEVRSLGVVVVKQIEKGILVGSYPELRVGFASADGDPHELCEKMRSLFGSRVTVTVIPEQMSFLGAKVDRSTGEILEEGLVGSAAESDEGE
jgi:hypothetical protein